MLKRKLLSVFMLYAFLLPTVAFGQTAAPAPYQAPKEAIDKIKEEGSKNSQVMQHFELSDGRDRRQIDQFAEYETRQRMDARRDEKMGNAKRPSRSVGTVRTRLGT